MSRHRGGSRAAGEVRTERGTRVSVSVIVQCRCATELLVVPFPAAKNERPWRSSSNEQLTDGDGTAKYMGRNFPDEFAQLSLEEEESDDEVHGISETMVKDVEKAAVELLAGR